MKLIYPILFICLCSIAVATDISPGTCITVNATNTTTDYCCSDCEVQECDTSQSNLNLDLDCGQSVSGIVNQWNYTIDVQSMSAGNNTQCIYTQSVDSGDRLIYNSDACKLDIKCKEPDDPITCEDLVEEKTSMIVVNIDREKDANLTTLMIDGTEFTIHDNYPFTSSFEIPATCGYQNNISKNCSSLKCTIEECQPFCLAPSFIAESYDKWTTATMKLNGDSVSIAGKLESCQKDKSFCDADLQKVQNDLANCDKERLAKDASLGEADKVIADQKGTIKIQKVFLWLISIAFAFMLVIIALLILWIVSRRG
jgi:hypothetical protein